MSLSDRLTKDAARDLARRALARHLPGRDFGLGCLKHKDDPMAMQVFCAADPEGRIAVKLWAPAYAEKAAAQAARQAEVAQQMTGPFGAPRVLFFDPETLCLAMEYVDGPSLSALWPTLDNAEMLRRIDQAGRWTAALHSLTQRDHPFRPKGQIAWLHRLLDWHDEGRRTIPDIAAFRAEVARMEALFPAVRGKPGRRAVTHRDMHLDNLIVSPDGLCGVDFENAKEDEPHRDLVWLLVDAMTRAPEADMTALAAALSRGYGDTVTDPGARLFLQRLFALGIWAATPASPSLRQTARHAAARAIIAADAPLFA